MPEKKRQFQVFCVGLPRSGTHSIANIFNRSYRADHEPFAGATVKILLEIYKNNRDREKIIDHLKIRDGILQLELESAHYLHKLVPELVSLFPKSKFILTIREPRTWLESEINKNYQSTSGKIWSKLEYARYNRYGFDYETPKLKSLKGVYPISNYLKYYVEHINLVLKNVPSDRLLILDTFHLNTSVDKLCEFTGASCTKLNLSKIHSSKRTKKKVKLNDYISEQLVYDKIEEICSNYICENLPKFQKYLANS